MCVCVCEMCPGTGRRPSDPDMSLVCPFSACGLSHLIFGCQSYPSSTCWRGCGSPCPVVTSPGRPHSVSAITLVPWPFPAFHMPLVGAPAYTAFIHPSPNRHCNAIGPGAQILTLTLATWTHRCQGRCRADFTAPALHFRRPGRLAFLHHPVCPTFGAHLGGGASEVTSEPQSCSPFLSCPCCSALSGFFWAASCVTFGDWVPQALRELGVKVRLLD